MKNIIVILLILYFYSVLSLKRSINPLFDYSPETAPDGGAMLTNFFNSNAHLSGVIFNPYDTYTPSPLNLVPTSNVGGIPAYLPCNAYFSGSTNEFVLNQTTYWSYINSTVAYNIVPQPTGPPICFYVSDFNLLKYQNSLALYRRIGSSMMQVMPFACGQIDLWALESGIAPISDVNCYFDSDYGNIADSYITYGPDISAPGTGNTDTTGTGCQDQYIGLNAHVSRYALIKYGVQIPYAWSSASYYPDLNYIGLSNRNVIQSVNYFNTISRLPSGLNLNTQFSAPYCQNPIDWCSFFNSATILPHYSLC